MVSRCLQHPRLFSSFSTSRTPGGQWAAKACSLETPTGPRRAARRGRRPGAAVCPPGWTPVPAGAPGEPSLGHLRQEAVSKECVSAAPFSARRALLLRPFLRSPVSPVDATESSQKSLPWGTSLPSNLPERSQVLENSMPSASGRCTCLFAFQNMWLKPKGLSQL